jgi:hypothetical protein
MLAAFFKGWKRKIGVMTLLMACMLAAGWLRSLHVYTKIEFPVGARTTAF